MLMNKNELEEGKASLKRTFLYYSRIYSDRLASGRIIQEEMDYLIIQIDVVLDWYIGLTKNKEE